ncbi:uncharacterized protein LOC124286079 [Haliotis rubra]|uniref:uncharacterized protein LOC124286079 n=1 Tax=Haliotis rubra TaxID=36100 RepID=UPI001EE5EC40|nr:uncharacterized protein LOC124286079 [Haliotis rubra]
MTCHGVLSFSAVRTICDVLDVHKQYWKSLKFRVKIPTMAQVLDMEQNRKAESGPTEPSVDEVTEKMSSTSVDETPAASTDKKEESAAPLVVVVVVKQEQTEEEPEHQRRSCWEPAEDLMLQ